MGRTERTLAGKGGAKPPTEPHRHSHVERRHTHAHDHRGHDHHAAGAISTAFILNAAFSVIEVAGGLWTGSVAVLSDALHDFGDTIALGFSFLFERIARKKRDPQFSYGYRRFSLLAALTNGIVLLVGSAGLAYMAVTRLIEPPVPVYTPGMIGLAVLGITFNGLGVLRLRRGRTMNERVLTWHLLEDVFGWTTILIAGVLMHLFPLPILDPLVALAFTLFTLWNSVRLLKQTLMVFLQSTPHTVDARTIEDRLMNVPGVASLHDTHIWSMDGEYHVLTTHLVIPDRISDRKAARVKQEARSIIEGYSIHHATIEMERASESCDLRNC